MAKDIYKPPAQSSVGRAALIGGLVLALGLAERAWLLDMGTRYGYWSDHATNVCWGLTAQREGLLKLYPISADRQVDVQCRLYQNGARVVHTLPGLSLNIPIYPPLALTILWLQAKLLAAVNSPPVANTFTAKLIMGAGPMLFDLLLAVGAMLLARRLFSPKAGFVAGAVCWLFPPLAMNSAYWGQVDSLLLAPAIFVLLFMLRRQWVLAGVCLGLAAMLKAQTVLLAPVVLFAAVAVEEKAGRLGQTRRVQSHLASERGGTPLTGRPSLHVFRLVLLRLVKMGAAAMAVIVVASLPWMFAGGLAWAQRSYFRMIVEAYPMTTLKAFNFWYLDALRLDSSPVFVLDSRATIWGITKDTWGKVLLLAAGAAMAALCWKKFRRRPAGVVAFAALWLWSTFLWPTRVHERYMIYCVPLVIVLAAGLRRYWPAVLCLLVLGVAEHTWNTWLSPPAGALVSRAGAEQFHQAVLGHYQPPPTDAQIEREYFRRVARAMPNYRLQREKVEFWEYLLTFMSLGAYGLAIWATAPFVNKKTKPFGEPLASP